MRLDGRKTLPPLSMPHPLGYVMPDECFPDSPPRPPLLSEDEEEDEGLTPLLSGAEDEVAAPTATTPPTTTSIRRCPYGLDDVISSDAPCASNGFLSTVNRLLLNSILLS